MNHLRPAARCRLAAAVSAAVALTAGTSVSLALAPSAAVAASPAALARPVGADTTFTTGQTPVVMPSGVVVDGIGTTGFLSSSSQGTTRRYWWTQFADGITTELTGGVRSWSPSDVVLLEQEDAWILQDMSGDSAPVRIDHSALSVAYTLRRSVGATLVMTAANAAGGTDLHLVDASDSTVRDRTVTGLPADASYVSAGTNAPAGTFLLRYSTAGVPSWSDHVALVDIATASVTETYAAPGMSIVDSVAASADHVAWSLVDPAGGRTVVVAPRGGGEPRRIALGGDGTLRVHLLGDWVLYAHPGGESASSPDPLHALTAQSLTTGATVKLLDDTRSELTSADGTLYAQGGTLAQGEGLYRISLGPDGIPVASMTASSGEPTALAILGNTIPQVIDLDHNRGTFSLDTTVSRPQVRLELELTHTASKRRWTSTRVPPVSGDSGATTIRVDWDGRFNLGPGEKGEFATAYNGAYTWRITATPLNGIGPATQISGSFTVARKQAPHDYNDNGSPDLLAVDSTGRLQSYDSAFRSDDTNIHFWTSVTSVGPGWQAYDRYAAAGNLGGTPYADIVTRDKTGVLWVYDGTGSQTAPFAPRRKVGSGWQIYDKITAGSDLDRDGRPDLLAADKTGVLWLYKGTGSINAPFAARVRIGSGWQIYNQITAVGDVAGTGAGDLVARDTAGVLWLYLGRGDGTFAARTRIGTGWNAYSRLVAVGDANRDGRPDLVGYGGGTTYVYTSTGDPQAPFAARRSTTGFQPATTDIAVF